MCAHVSAAVKRGLAAVAQVCVYVCACVTGGGVPCFSVCAGSVPLGLGTDEAACIMYLCLCMCVRTFATCESKTCHRLRKREHDSESKQKKAKGHLCMCATAGCLAPLGCDVCAHGYRLRACTCTAQHTRKAPTTHDSNTLDPSLFPRTRCARIHIRSALTTGGGGDLRQGVASLLLHLRRPRPPLF